MKKILFVAMAAIMLLGMFGGIKTTVKASVNPNGTMYMNPHTQLVNSISSSQMTFLYPIYLTGVVVGVSGWDAALYWDSSVLRALDVVWGNFMDGHGAATINVTNFSPTTPGASSGKLGQSYASQPASYPTGSGWLASVNFTFVLPGATYVNFSQTYPPLIYDSSNNALNVYSSDPSNGIARTDFPRPVFTWSTPDGQNPLPAKNASTGPPAATLSPSTGQIYDGGRLVNVTSSATQVNFDASGSYDVSNLVWQAGGGFALVGGAGIASYSWNFGDGTTGTGVTVSHQYLAYNQSGWLVTLTVTDSDQGNTWKSTWRFGGADPSNTVPMWRDVAIVDIWPSLPPYATWDLGIPPTVAPHTTDADWWYSWYFSSTDFWLPNTADKFWNYNMSDSFCDVNAGINLPSPDTRLMVFSPLPYANGTRVSASDSDVGNALSPLGDGSNIRGSPQYAAVYNLDGTTKTAAVWPWYATLGMYFDANGDKMCDAGDTVVTVHDPTINSYDNATYYFSAGAGDAIVEGPALIGPTNKLSYFTMEGFNDTNGNGILNVGENIYWDEYDAASGGSCGFYGYGTVSAEANPTVTQAYNFADPYLGGSVNKFWSAYGLGSGGIWVLVTANNFGTVTEKCTINLYAIGLALKVGSPTAGVYPLVQVVSLANIGTWTKLIKAGSGTGWGCATGWMPDKNATYILMATIYAAQGAEIDDKVPSNNYQFLSTPVSNICTFNSTSGAIIPPAYTNAKYLADFGNKGTVGPADLAYLVSQYGSAGKAGNSVIPISKP